MAKHLLYYMETADFAIKKQKKNTRLFKEYIPDHIIEETLLKLPPKSLLRFKCLSKSWHYTISSPLFSRAHLRENKTNPPLIVADDRQTLAMFGLDKEADHIALSLEEHLKIQSELTGYNINLKIENSCDGIFCIRTNAEHIIKEKTCSQNPELVLWNPSIRKHKILTVPKKEYRRDGFGIGYDPSINDYKIIKVMSKLDNKSKNSLYNEVELCTLKSNKWKPLFYDLSYTINIWLRPVSVKGVMYWHAYRKEEKGAIVCLDLANESFSTVELPPIAREVILGLGELEGKLGFYCRGHNSSGNCYFDVWVMEENQTWVRLISMSYKFVGDPLRLHLHGFTDATLKLKLLSSINTLYEPFFWSFPSLINFD